MARRLKVRDFGKSINFVSSSNQKVDLGVDFIGAGAATFVGWIKPKGYGENSQGSLVDNSKYRIRLSSTGQIQISADIITYASSAAGAITLNKWQHVALTRDSSGVSNIYVNGVLSGSANQAGGTPSAAGLTNLLIGTNNATNRDYFGYMDSIRFFNRVLTATEIADMYYDGCVPSDLAGAQLAHYNFNDNVLDQTGNGHDGTVTGATYSSDVPMRRRMAVQPSTSAIDFNGGTDKIQTTGDWIGVGDVTFSVWVFVRSLGGANGGRIIHGPKILFLCDTSNRFALASDGVTIVRSASGSLIFNKWTHVTVTRTSAGSTTFYINGQSSGTLAQSSGTPSTAAGDTYIGNFSAGTRGFDGLMANLIVHNRILTQQEIEDLYFDGVYTSTPLASYTFDNTLVDGSGSPTHDGTATGTAFSTNVRSTERVQASNRLAVRDFGTALYFGASTSDKVVITNTGGQVHDNISDLTVTLWMKPSKVDVANNFAFSIPATAGNNRKYIIISSSGSLRVNGGVTQTDSALKLIPNKWYFIAFRINAGAGNYDAYVNNVNWIPTTASVVGTGNANVIIGSQNTADQEFNGIIDNVRMHNRVLTLQEISDMYYFGTIPKDSSLLGEWKFDEGSGSTALDTSGRGNNGTITGATYTTSVPFIPRTLAN